MKLIKRDNLESVIKYIKEIGINPQQLIKEVILEHEVKLAKQAINDLIQGMEPQHLNTIREQLNKIYCDTPSPLIIDDVKSMSDELGKAKVIGEVQAVETGKVKKKRTKKKK